jgi:hypothetical protein
MVMRRWWMLLDRMKATGSHGTSLAADVDRLEGDATTVNTPPPLGYTPLLTWP